MSKHLTVARKTRNTAISLLMTFALVFDGVPSRAWAEVVDEISSPSIEESVEADDHMVGQGEPAESVASVDGQGLDEPEEQTLDAGASDLADPIAQEGALTVEESESVPGHDARGDEENDATSDDDISLTAQADEGNDVDSGVWGTCAWTLDASGTMRVEAGEGGYSYHAPWKGNDAVKAIIFASGVRLPNDCTYLFSSCSSLTSLDLSGCDTSQVTSMHQMFLGCSSLTSLDLSGWDTSQVTSMEAMFFGCSSLISLDLTGWDTSQVTDMMSMFEDCSLLASLDVTGWDTSKVTAMNQMFLRCSSLKQLDLSKWNTSSVTDMSWMFFGCTSLTSLDLTGWDTANVAKAANMFVDCESLTTVTLGEHFSFSDPGPDEIGLLPSGAWKAKSDGTAYVPETIPAHVADTYELDKSWTQSDTCIWRVEESGRLVVKPAGISEGALGDISWSDGGSWGTDSSGNEIHITSAVFEGNIRPARCDGMFAGCTTLESADCSGLDTSAVTSLSSMFNGCSSLKALDLSHWNTKHLEDVSNMFNGCSQLATLSVSGWNTSNVTNMEVMFYDCRSLASLDLSSWDVSCVTNMQAMFSGCSSLEYLDLSSWEPLRVENADSMFADCTQLASLNLSGWNAPKLTTISNMLSCCSKLSSLELLDWNAPSLRNVSFAFFQCSSLESLDLSCWDTSNVTACNDVFGNCRALSRISVGGQFETNKAFPDSGPWWSEAEEKWFDVSEIRQSRSRIADTYWRTSQGISISKATVTLENEHCTYCGSQICPTVSAVFDSSSLEEGVDFTVEYGENTNAGTGTVRVMGLGEFRGTEELEFTIDPKEVTVTAADLSKAVDEDDPKLTASVTGLLGDDTVLYTLSREPGEAVGTYAIEPSGDGVQGNYQLSFVPGTLTITSPISRVTIAAIEDQEYCGEGIKPKLTVNDGEAELKADVDYEVAYRDNKDIGQARVTLTGIGVYTGTTEVTFQIVPRSVMVQAPSVEKTYGEDDPDLVPTIDGLLKGDEIAYDVMREPGESIGEYEVSVRGEELQGNYHVSYASGTLTIQQRKATVTADRVTKAYGDDDPELTATVEGVLEGDELEYTLSREAGESLGAYPVAVTGKEAQGNYSVTFVGGELVVEPRLVKVTVLDATKKYGEPDPTFEVNTEGLLAGETVSWEGPTREAGEDTGTYEVVTSGEEFQGNYRITYVPGTLTIVGTPLSDAAVAAVADVTYDGTAQEPKPEVTLSGRTLVLGTDYELAYRDNVDAGEATLVVSGVGNFEGTVESTFKILPRDVTVAAGKHRKQYGDPDPAFEATEEGLLSGDSLAYEMSREEGEAVGTYAVTPHGEELQGNYRVSFEPGELTIEPYTVTISAVSDWKCYGDPDPELHSTIDTSIMDHPDLVDISYRLVREPGEDVGDYAITFVGDEYQGNYRLVFEPAELSIAYRSVRVLVDDQTKGCGQPDPEFTSSVEGVLHDDHIEYTLTREPGEDVGDYLISAVGEELQGNYLVTYVPGLLTIENPSIASATIAPIPDQLYDGKPFEPKPEVTLNGRTLELGTDYTLSYRDNNAVGTATVVVTGIGNYGGKATATFRICSHDLDELFIDLERNLYLESAVPARPEVYVYDLNDEDENGDPRYYEEGIDFEVTYVGGDELGKAKAIVRGIGQLAGEVEVGYEVVETIDITDWRSRISFELPDGEGYLYRGGPVKPRVDVSPMTRYNYPDGVDFEVEYLGNNRIGTAIAIVRGTGDFTGETRLEYRISRATSVTLDGSTEVDFKDALMYYWGVGGSADAKPSYLQRPGESRPRPECEVRAKIGESPDGFSIMALLAEGVDYKLEYQYSSSTNAACYVVITGLGDVGGSARAPFLLEDGDIDVSWLEYEILRTRQPEYRYEGKPVEPKLAYHPSFVEGLDYTLSYEGNEGPGTCVVRVTGKGLFKGTTAIVVPIVEQYQKAQLSDCLVEVASATYTGSALTPDVTLTNPQTGEQIDLSGDSFVIRYENNTNAGKGTVHIRAYNTRRYEGYVTQDFDIQPASLDGATVTIADQAYTGSRVEPSVNVVCDGRTLAQGSDYLVAYADNVSAGTATATVIGRGNYTGKASGSFAITNSAPTYQTGEDYVIPILPDGTRKTALLKPLLSNSPFGVDSSCSFELYVPRTSYGDFLIENKGGRGGYLNVKIKDSRGVVRFDDTILIKSSPGRCYIPPVSPLTGKVTPVVLPAGMAHVEMDYRASDEDNAAMVSLSCVLSDVPAVSLKGADVEIVSPKPLYWEQVDGVDTPVYLMRDGEMPGAPEVRVTAKNALGEAEVLREGTDYWTEWVTAGAGQLAGVGRVLVYGVGAYKDGTQLDVMVTHVIDVQRLGLTEKDLQRREYVYAGTPVEPRLRHRDDFVEGVDYTLSYRYNDRVGVCVVTVEGIGEYYGTATIEVPVVAAPTHPLLDDCEVIVADATPTYTGKAVDPGVVVVDPATGEVLRRDRDYMLTFESGVNVGEAKVHVSACMDGDGYTYDGHNEAAYTIVSAPISRCSAGVAKSVACTGSALRPTVKVVDPRCGRVLASGTDYSVSYRDNTYVGTATVTITGRGNYGGTLEKTFKITPAKQVIEAANLEVQLRKSARVAAKVTGPGAVTYTSSKPGVAAVSAKGVVTGKKAGTAKITITAAATKVYGKATKTITVKVGKANPLKPAPKAKSVTASLATLKKKAVALASNVKFAKKGQGKVTYANASTNKVAKKFKVNAKTGKVTVPKGTKKGTYAVKITVKAAGNATYISGTKTVSFKVVVK